MERELGAAQAPACSHEIWQTFGRLMRFNQFIQRERDFSNRFGCVYGARNVYALYAERGRFLTR